MQMSSKYQPQNNLMSNKDNDGGIRLSHPKLWPEKLKSVVRNLSSRIKESFKNPQKRKIIVLVSLVLTASFISFFLLKFILEPTAIPKEAIVSNLTDQSVTISWTTEDKPTKGSIYYSKSNNYLPLISRHTVDNQKDERDLLTEEWYGEKGSRRYYTHYVTLYNLEPETEYFIRIRSGNRLYEIEEVKSVKTYATLDEQTAPDPMYGRVMREGSEEEAMGAIVSMRLEKEDGEKSNLLSCLTKDNGTYTIDLANARTENGAKFFGTLKTGDKEIVSVNSAKWGEATATIKPDQDQPASDIVLTGDESDTLSYREPLVDQMNEFQTKLAHSPSLIAHSLTLKTPHSKLTTPVNAAETKQSCEDAGGTWKCLQEGGECWCEEKEEEKKTCGKAEKYLDCINGKRQIQITHTDCSITYEMRDDDSCVIENVSSYCQQYPEECKQEPSCTPWSTISQELKDCRGTTGVVEYKKYNNECNEYTETQEKQNHKDCSYNRIVEEFCDGETRKQRNRRNFDNDEETVVIKENDPKCIEEIEDEAMYPKTPVHNIEQFKKLCPELTDINKDGKIDVQDFGKLYSQKKRQGIEIPSWCTESITKSYRDQEVWDVNENVRKYLEQEEEKGKLKIPENPVKTERRKLEAYAERRVEWIDNDGDGFTEVEGDCDDNNKLIYPGAFEIKGDYIDSNCDGLDYKDVSVTKDSWCKSNQVDYSNYPCFELFCHEGKRYLLKTQPDHYYTTDNGIACKTAIEFYNDLGFSSINRKNPPAKIVTSCMLRDKTFLLVKNPVCDKCKTYAFCDENGKMHLDFSYLTKRSQEKAMEPHILASYCNAESVGIWYKDRKCIQIGKNQFRFVKLKENKICQITNEIVTNQVPIDQSKNLYAQEISICVPGEDGINKWKTLQYILPEALDFSDWNWQNYKHKQLDKDMDGYIAEGTLPFEKISDDLVEEIAIARRQRGIKTLEIRHPDCNDNAYYVHPFAKEEKNGLDDNCNGEIDEGVITDADNAEFELTNLLSLLEDARCSSKEIYCASEYFNAETFNEAVKLDSKIPSIICLGGRLRITQMGNKCNPASSDYYINRRTFKRTKKTNNFSLEAAIKLKCEKIYSLTKNSTKPCNCNTRTVQSLIEAERCYQIHHVLTGKANLNQISNCSTAHFGMCHRGKVCYGKDLEGNDIFINNPLVCNLPQNIGIPLDNDHLATTEEIEKLEKNCNIILHNTAELAWTKKAVSYLYENYCNSILFSGGREEIFEKYPLNIYLEQQFPYSEFGGQAYYPRYEEGLKNNSINIVSSYLQQYNTFGNSFSSYVINHETMHLLDVIIGEQINEDKRPLSFSKEWQEASGWKCPEDARDWGYEGKCTHPCLGYINSANTEDFDKECKHPNIEPFITGYASTNTLEDIAETGRKFTDPEKGNNELAEVSPKRCEYFRKYVFPDYADDPCYDCNPDTECDLKNARIVFDIYAQEENEVTTEEYFAQKQLSAKLTDTIKVKSGNDQVTKYAGQHVNVFGYLDTNGNQQFDPGEAIVPPPDDYMDKLDIQQVKTYELKTGWNLVSFPLVLDEEYTASKLLEEIAEQGGYATTVSTYESGKWITYKQRADISFSDEDFKIYPGRGYWIRIHKPVTYQIAGHLPENPTELDLETGWNLVGIHSGYNEDEKQEWNHDAGDDGWKAGELIDTVQSEDIKLDIVTQYKGGKYESYIKDKPSGGNEEIFFGTDYILEEKKGYFVRVRKGGNTFTP